MSKPFISKPLILVAGAVIAAGLGFYVLKGNDRVVEETVPEGPRPVRTVTLETRGATLSRSYSGRVKASREADLTFRVSGPITELPVLKGQTVQEGELLARIDPRDYETNLANSRSALDNARAQLKAMKEGSRSEEIAVLEASLRSARSQRDEAKANYDRYKALVKQGAVSEAEFERFETSYKVAQSQVKTAEEQLKQGRTGARREDVEAMESTIQGLEATVKAAQDALNDTTLTAPFNGRISDRYVDQYENVQAGQPIVHVQDIFALDVVINVPESDLARGRTGDVDFQALARFDAMPDQSFQLTLKEISTQADPQSQTYPVTLSMGEVRNADILPGMIAEVDVTVSLTDLKPEESRAWPVPVEAVFMDPQGLSRVWVVDADTNEVRSVQVQIHNYAGDEVYISGDLKEGDEVVSAGTDYLTEGEAVRILEGRIGK